MRILEITIDDVLVRAELLVEEAPVTCENIKSFSPIQGLLNHAKICDNEVFVMVPFYQDKTENMKIPEIGELGYWVARQTICIWFDKTVPLGPSNIFARILPEDIKRFAEVGRRVWTNEKDIFIKMEIKN